MYPDKILILSTVRNCEKNLYFNYKKINTVLKNIFLKWVVIESDSNDNTVSILEKISKKNKNFHFYSYQNLKKKIPDRIERIAYCRNKYLLKIKKFKNFNYSMVIDLDEKIDLFNVRGFKSCFKKKINWDVCCANQLNRYYDIFSLRHKFWSNTDCWKEVEFKNRFFKNKYLNIYTSVHSKMIKILKDSKWIKVDSAFGGMAIYKNRILKGVKYKNKTLNGDECGEHVSFNEQIRLKNKGKIFINPKFYNLKESEHSKGFNLIKLKSLLKNLIKN